MLSYHLTNILNLLISAFSLTQIARQRPPEQLKQHLEADSCNRRIVSSLRKLIADESMLRPRWFVETERSTRFVKSLADEVTAGWRNVVVTFAENLKDQRVVTARYETFVLDGLAV